jgi:hypothetical protein
MFPFSGDEAMYNVKKFPEIDKNNWIVDNAELVNEQLAKFKGVFEGPVERSFQEVMSEYVFLSSTMQEIAEWKDNLARFLSYTMTVDEAHLRERDSSKDYHGGRLSLLKELLEWF